MQVLSFLLPLWTCRGLQISPHFRLHSALVSGYYISIELYSVGLQRISNDCSLALGLKLLFVWSPVFAWQFFSHFSLLLFHFLPVVLFIPSFPSLEFFLNSCLHQCASQSADVLARVCCWMYSMGAK